METNEKEFAVIREISNHHRPTQRLIAQRIGISLGLTNLLIKRLIKKGYIKIQEAPARTIMYSLTPKGLSEKTNKSYQFTIRTINIIKQVKDCIKDLIANEYEQGVRNFGILGDGEIAKFVEIVFEDLTFKDISCSKKEYETKEDVHGCYLLVSQGEIERKIDIINELAKQGVYY